MGQERIYWLGPAPRNCDMSGLPIISAFIDGATIFGSWAIMHPDAFATYGTGFGQGKGQRYELQAERWSDGSPKWMKVEG